MSAFAASGSPAKAARASQPSAEHWGWPPAKAGGPAYPLCTQRDWRGEAAPPFEPPASRAAAGAPDDRGRSPGRSPRPPAPARARRSGAVLWSPPTSPRSSRSPSTRRRRPSTSASRTAPPTEAPPAAAWTRRRRGRKPSRRDLSRQRRGLGAPPTMKQPALQAPGFWDAERPFGGGRSQPHSTPKSGEWIR